MKKWRLSVSVFLMTAACSAAALAGVYQVVGEAYGHTAEEAIDNALREAEETCYQNWGRSSQDYTVLAQWVDAESGYPYARVSLECSVED